MRFATVRHPVAGLRRIRTMPRWVRRADRAASRRINASRSWHAHDRGFGRLSHSADRGLLWYAIAAALFLLGYRRAAVRGIGSMLVAGVTSDVIVKGLFDGERPAFSEVPVGRRLRSYPTTLSFPSGHSASAAGFATGIALESGRAGIVVAPIAAAVAYSRMHVGAHWLSDVVGGVVIGIGVAAVGRLVFPGSRRRRVARA